MAIGTSVGGRGDCKRMQTETACKQFPEAHTVFPLLLLARTKSYGHLQLQGKLENGMVYWAALCLAKD